MKDRSLMIAALVGALSGTLVGAGTFYYAQLMSFSPVNPAAVDQDMTLQSYYLPDFEYRTKRQMHGGDLQKIRGGRAAAPSRVNPLTLRCEGLSGARYTKCVGNAQEGIRYQRD